MDLFRETARGRAARRLRQEMPELDDIAVTRLLDDIGADPASRHWKSQMWIDRARARLTPRWWFGRRLGPAL